MESPFLLPDEVDTIARSSDDTRMRQEKKGRFPKRIKIAAKKIAYRKSEIEEWARDPEAWRARNAVAAGAEA